MNRVKVLAISLSISFGANLYFIYKWVSVDQNQAVELPASESVTGHGFNNSMQGESLEVRAEPNVDIDRPLDSSSKTQSTLEKDEHAYLSYLRDLASQKQFELLEYHVSNFLRLYPFNQEAIMLEALAYYHTKPLSIALVHYKDLLSQPLTKDQKQEINKIVTVNTSRVIQQFTGDRAWGLLAEFLEPLVQVDPTNRQYLMALARAYGMQSQFTLMEDVLANFRSDDPRSNRLRENVLSRLSSNDSSVSIPIEQATLGELDIASRTPDLTLNQSRGQFIASANLSSVPVNLLVDTGASTTAISNVKFVEIEDKNTEFLGLFTVNTAGGIVRAPIYKVSSMIIGNKLIDNLSVLVLPEENLGRFDGLLGMNVLSQFDLTYDATAQTMKLYKK